MVQENPRPLMVDLWAPWCAPCRMMAPAFHQASETYAGQVDVLKINADESPEVLRALGVMSIPTLVGFAGGKEVLRRSGVQSLEVLELLFDALAHQRAPGILPLAPVDRILRTGVGVVFLALGWINRDILPLGLILLGVGAAALFSAIYDRCPIYRAVAPRVKAFFSRSKQA